MSCGFDKGLLAAHYDGETTPAERAEVERHLGTCPECARDLDSMKRLSGALKPLSKATAPMSIAEGVMREIGPRRSAPRPWLRWWVTAAASVVLAIGTFLFIAPERSSLGRSVETAAAPAKKPAEVKEAYSRNYERMAEGAKPPAAPEPAPAAEALDHDESKAQLSELKKEEPPGYLAELAAMYRNWTGMQFVRVKSPDPAAVRGIVETYLKEKKLQQAPEGPVLSLDNLKIDRTDAELKELERRLAAHKETTLVRTSLEEEQKRLSDARKMKSADAGKDDAPADKEKAARSRAAPSEKRDEQKRTWVLFVFESAEAKK